MQTLDLRHGCHLLATDRVIIGRMHSHAILLWDFGIQFILLSLPFHSKAFDECEQESKLELEIKLKPVSFPIENLEDQITGIEIYNFTKIFVRICAINST
jgi:hypothetical protein